MRTNGAIPETVYDLIVAVAGLSEKQWGELLAVLKSGGGGHYGAQ